MSSSSELPPCKFGDHCYRKNAAHLRSFSHPLLSNHSDEPKKNAAQSSKAKITSFFTSDRIVDSPPARKRKRDSADSEKLDTTKKAVRDVSDKKPVVFDEISGEVKQRIKNQFCIEIPEDFFLLWKYCCKKNVQNPSVALSHTFGLHLVGPYDVLSGRFENCRVEKQYLHWRYYYDPPEFLTILAELNENSDGVRMPVSSGFHMGYFRDDPTMLPEFVAWNYAEQNGNLLIKGDNIFASLRLFGEELIRNKSIGEKRVEGIREELKSLQLFLEEEHTQFCLDAASKKIKARDKKVVAKTFHGAGLVVPVVNDVGYRPLPESVAGLKKILSRIVEAKSESAKLTAFEPLQQIVTLCQFANDEGDFGEAIELGLDLFTFGSEALHSTISHLLPLAYRLAGRGEFAEVVEQHLTNRRSLTHCIDMSVCDSATK